MVNESKVNDPRFWKKWQESGAIGSLYNKGCMPNTDFRYEEFEGLLGSFYLTFKPLKHNDKPEDRRDYQIMMEILNGFAEKYGVQRPKNATRNPRAQEEWGNAHPFISNWSTLDMMGSFWRDFGVGADPKTEDGQKRYKLGRLILGIFDRYGIAKIGYETFEGEQVPVKVEEWNRPKDRKTFANVLSE